LYNEFDWQTDGNNYAEMGLVLFVIDTKELDKPLIAGDKMAPSAGATIVALAAAEEVETLTESTVPA